MAGYLFPVLFTVLVWWLSTGVILYLVGLPQRTFRWTFAGASGVLAAALFGLAHASAYQSAMGSYVAFACALLVWAWQEIGFLVGFVTGPRRTPCPSNVSAARRTLYALQTILHHEYALVLLACAVTVVTWDKPNQVGFWAFMILWAMRQSAKLNLFLGVRNLSEEFLPEHLRYMATYFRRKPMNALFPFSVGAGTIAAILTWQHAFAAAPGSGAATGSALLATLLCAAVLEHLFMVTPLPATALWRWGLRSRESPTVPSPATSADRMRSWTASLPGPCDPEGVRNLLDAAARGRFGEVERVRGIARAGSGWIRFEMIGGHSNIATFAPHERDRPCVIALGHRVDEARLQAAFDACVAAPR